jgi:hypothetical protein
MTFEEWYKWYNPEMDPLEDDCLDELMSAFETGRRQGYVEGSNDTWTMLKDDF